ncbi:MAG: hypothetical protein GXO50_07445 [Chlorobi bacterium]|nr:hypothetical protein [Chlorobiota bacterium]
MILFSKKLLLPILTVLFSLNTTAQELTILHTNDMHSKLTGYGPENAYTPEILDNDKTLGGFARLAALFEQEKRKNKDATLILDAGDFLMGSLFHVAEKETGFQTSLMKEIGYDFITLGNHEFDFGPEVLAQILNKAEENGGYPDIVSANIVFDKTSETDDALEKIYEKGKIRHFAIINKNGLKIAIFGLTGEDASDVAPAKTPVIFTDPIKTAKETVKMLKEEYSPDLIICLSHCGFKHTKNNTSYEGEDIDLAEKVPDIDIIISGHTHVATPKAIKKGNTYIVQTGEYAMNTGKINLKAENGKISKFDFKLIPVNDDIKGDLNIHKKIEAQKEYIDKKYLSKINLSYNTKSAYADFDLKKDKGGNLGPFTADADKFYLEKNGVSIDFSMVASGTIRENILKGIQTVPDAFRVMSLGQGYDGIPGYPLAKVYVTAKEIKKLSEIIIMSRPEGGDGYLYVSGLKIYYNPDKMMLRKVRKIELNGKELDFSKKNKNLYSIAADTYLLGFIGRIKKMSHGLITVIPKDKNGNPVTNMKNQIIDINPDKAGIQEAKEWIALIEYMKSFAEDNKNLPHIPDKYKRGDESSVIIKD